MSNPFKNFVVYNLTVNDGAKHLTGNDLMAGLLNLNDDIETQQVEAMEPSGGSYSRLGFAEIDGDDRYMLDLNGAAVLLGIKINERILPAKVRDAEVKVRMAALADLTGRPGSKKEWAQTRDEVEFEMLPKAFIREQMVYVMITPESQMFVFCAAGKKAQSVCDIVFNFFNTFYDFTPSPLSFEKSVVSYLNGVARDTHGEAVFYPRSEGKFKGPEKRVVSVKDRDIGAHEIQALLKADYDVHELGMDWIEEGEVDPLMSFRFDDKLCFRGCTIGTTNEGNNEERGEDKDTAFFSIAWLTATTYRRLVTAISAELAGPADESDSTTNDEDF
jgi:recombination associated protein RdgC